jgi:diguanylate cyclase (GGDEF)-like protein
LELNLIKDNLVRKLTTTLNTKLLSQILANNLIRNFDIPAVAVYLKNIRGEDFELILNKGFSSLKAFVEPQYVEKIKTYDGFIFEEKLNWTIDAGVCDIKTPKLLVFKLLPRKGKVIGLVFLGLDEQYDPCSEKLLRNFLQEIGATVSLIFENALEHEKSILLASYDPLTGAYNRQEGLKAIRALLKKAEFEHKNVCLLLLDIDLFKKINDTYGHDVGDIVLREVVSIIRNSVRNKDIVVRWGGEEFLIVVDSVLPEKAREIAERIRKNVENTPIVINEKLKINITVSIGVACTEREGTYFFDELFNIADKRLYRAKSAGRNTVIAD